MTMTVMDVLRKQDLIDFDVTYENQYGTPCQCDLKDMAKFMNQRVKSLHIHYPTNSCTITVIEEVK